MNEIQQMQRFLLKAFSTARITLDEPIVKDGLWSLNVFLPGYHLAVAWQAGKGFGVVSDDSHGYGEGADEVFDDLKRALPRVVQLLAYRLATVPPPAVAQGPPRGARPLAGGGRQAAREETGFHLPRRVEIGLPRLHLAGVRGSVRREAGA